MYTNAKSLLGLKKPRRCFSKRKLREVRTFFIRTQSRSVSLEDVKVLDMISVIGPGLPVLSPKLTELVHYRLIVRNAEF